MREMGLVNCDLSPLEPDVIPGWNLPKEKLREMVGPGEVDRAVAWKDLTDEQRSFQATKMAIHAAMIDRMDREIGRVLEQVKAMGADENTVILFVSDNGASAEQIIRGDNHDPAAAPGSGRSYLCLGPGWSSAANSPFRLHKSWVHEGGISSPLIVHWPAGIAARGELRHNPCHFIDILPTVLSLAGGSDFSPKWNGEAAPPLPGHEPRARVCQGRDRHARIPLLPPLTNRAIRVGDWKLVAKGDKGPWELYDLKADRCESKNLAEQHPDKVAEMSALWQKCEDQFRQQAGPPPAGKRAKARSSELKPVNDGDSHGAELTHLRQLVRRILQWHGLADHGLGIQLAGDDHREHLAVLARLHPVASTDLKLPADHPVHRDSRQIILARQQSDLHVAASLAQAENGIAAGCHAAERIYRHIRAPSRHIADRAGDICVLLRVDRHGCAESLGESSSTLAVDIDADHLSPQGTGNHDRRQADAAAAVDSYPLAGRDPALRHDGTIGRGKPASETRGRDEIQLLRQADKVHIGVSNRDVLRERAPAGEARLELMVTNLVIP